LASKVAGQLPLKGVRVVALEQSVAGPLCSRILADLGASVVKVESADGDFARRWDSYVNGNGSHFVWLSRRKKSVRLDLHDPKDSALLHQLLGDADVLVMNMSASAAERIGMTEVALGDRFPRLITCHITGYGTKGKSRNRKAYDLLLQAETGLLSLTGDEHGPARIGVSVADIGSGMYAALLILAALVERANGGAGRFIDVSMFHAMTEFAGPNLTAFANSGVEYERRRLRHHNVVPYGIYECSDGHIAIAVEHDKEWTVFCQEVLDRPDLLQARFATNELRVRHRGDLDSALEEILRAQSRDFWIGRLEAAQLAYARINAISDVWEHAVVSDLNLRIEVKLPDGSRGWVLRSPAETAFGNEDEASIPALDADRSDILASRFRPNSLRPPP
jgi:formyl-CoA transferase